ncbi:MAG: nuclear transport factor 2 family protein [Gammaproteobacteria bacterium]|nr:nuclear transport factor 2 family protein [Gammaproteobacteria bacterium]
MKILEDKDEIRELTARYCYAVVAQDGAALLDMFASDGEFHMGTSSGGQSRTQQAVLRAGGRHRSQAVHPESCHPG